MRYEPEAIYIYPPTGSDQTIDGTGTLDPHRGQSIAFTTSSGAATQIAGSGYFTLTADQNVQVRFWRDNTAGPVLAADFPLWQFAYVNWVLDGLLFVRLKGMSASGTFYLYQSS